MCAYTPQSHYRRRQRYWEQEADIDRQTDKHRESTDKKIEKERDREKRKSCCSSECRYIRK